MTEQTTFTKTAAASVWESVVPKHELEFLEGAGFGVPTPLGDRPCLVVIDVIKSFLGPRPGTDEPDYPTSCGEVGWQRLPAIVRLVDAAREAGLPIVFCTGWPNSAKVVGGAIKLSRGSATAEAVHAAPLPEELQPRDDEFVMQKTKASAFFQTPLLTFMHQRKADSVILVGTTTSGCIRASAVDGSSYGFPVTVVEDATFDRSEFAHASNLFDIQMKYGNVVTTDELLATLAARG